jgi:hypothetical protein
MIMVLSFEKMRKISMLFIVLAAGCASAPKPPLAFDHVWMAVSPGAPERAVLERAGFRIAPGVNRHEGQGTASITVEFANGFVELLWPDETVPVTPGMERVVEKFRKRTAWRTSGWCPFSIGFRRTTKESLRLPFPTWSLTAAWLPPGAAIEMLTPRDDTTSPSLFISPRELSDHNPTPPDAIDRRRITAVRLIEPSAYAPIPALQFVEREHLLDVDRGPAWLVEVTLDGGRAGKVDDFRPELPLRIRR